CVRDVHGSGFDFW
nr:immunoglobulin heavy chain junction region [Macaca mulatta]